MAMDTHALLCRGYSLLHSQQYLGDFVHSHGCAQWRDGPLHQSYLLPLGD